MSELVTTGPIAEPLGLQDTKDFLRVDSSDEDSLISALIVAAREYCEAVTHRSFVTQSLRLTLDRWPRGNTIEMPRPFNDTTALSVSYFPSGSTAVVLASTAYIVDTDGEPGRIVLKEGVSWPTTQLRSANAIQVSFEAGYGAQDAVPEGVKHAMRFMVGHWYANREAVVVGTISSQLELSVGSLLGPHIAPFVA